MVHLLSQLDPMVWLMMVVVAIAFVVSAVMLVELLPGAGRREPEGAGGTGADATPGADAAPGAGVDTSPGATAGHLPAQTEPTGNEAPVG